MDARARVREYLRGGAADRPVVLAFTLDLAARVASATRAELLADPHLLSVGLRDAVRLCSLDSAVVALRSAELPGLATGTPPSDIACLAVCAEALARLRILLGDSAGITVLLPGPLTLLAQAASEAVPAGMAGTDHLEDAGMCLLGAATFLGPARLDTLGVWEEAPVAEAACLRDPLTPLWNAASFYSMPSLFIARVAGADAGSVGACAVAVLHDSIAEALAGAGAARVGFPIRPPPAPQLDAVPRNGFLITAGEVPAEADMTWLQELTVKARFRRDALTRSDDEADTEMPSARDWPPVLPELGHVSAWMPPPGR